jgi:protein transport protein SEC23
VNLPAELISHFTTVEYELPGSQSGTPAFIYVIDACLSEEELEALKDSIKQSLHLLPDNSLVGLVTFGTTVQV